MIQTCQDVRQENCKVPWSAGVPPAWSAKSAKIPVFGVGIVKIDGRDVRKPKCGRDALAPYFKLRSSLEQSALSSDFALFLFLKNR